MALVQESRLEVLADVGRTVEGLRELRTWSDGVAEFITELQR
jgi:hypothetical protein